jgi:peptidyl-prolyl cis-trans isomerase SurA
MLGKGFIWMGFFILWTNVILAQGVDNKVVDKIIAKVDNYIVLNSELEATMEQFVNNDPKMKKNPNLKCMVLENLIIGKLMLAKAEIDSVMVDDGEVQDQLDRRMDYFIAQAGNAENLVKAYGKSIDVLKDELRPQIKEQLTIQKMQDKISDDLKITPQEVFDFFSKMPKDSVPKVPVEVEVAHLIKVPKVNKAQKQTIKDKLEEIKRRIQAGEDFATLAKKYSEDYGSAKQGGEIGWTGRGKLVPQYEAAAFRLKPGELSRIVESDYGFHLIQLLERRGNEYNSRHILLRLSSAKIDKDQSIRFLDSLRRNILKDSISFENAARLNSDDKRTSTNGGYLASNKKIALSDLDSFLFLVLDTMKVNTISMPMPYRTDDGEDAFRIIFFKNKYPAHRASLETDYARINQAALSEKKQRNLDRWFKKAKQEVFIFIDPDFEACPILENQ